MGQGDQVREHHVELIKQFHHAVSARYETAPPSIAGLSSGHHRGLGQPHRQGQAPALVPVPGVDGGRPADCDEAPRPPREELGDHAQPAVAGDYQVPRATPETPLESLAEVRVLVNMVHAADAEIGLMQPAVHDRHVESPGGEPLHDRRPGRPGAADNQSFLLHAYPLIP